MQIDWIASKTSDNFFYLLHHDGAAALVDPVDHASAIDAVRARGLSLTYVLNTHWHPDHVSGDDAVLAAFPDAELLVPAAEADLIANLVERAPDRLLSGGDTIALGGAALDVVSTPGHTVGHVSFAFDHHLVSGDTLFAAGAGNVRFGGDPGVLFATFRDVLAPMPDATTLYPGHDYLARNLEFALSLEPGRAPVEAALEAARAKPDRALTPPTLGQERAVNPFMRFDDPDLLAALEAAHPDLVASTRAEHTDDPHEVCFRVLRALRDSW
jgi:hydroxyacylglutathione hydrolase